MKGLATNRQKKILKYFSINFHPSISKGAAGWEIGNILSDPVNIESWHKYLYLTEDYDNDSDELLPYESEQLEKIVLPEDFYAGREVKSFQAEIVAEILASVSPFDNPQPEYRIYWPRFLFHRKVRFRAAQSVRRLGIRKGWDSRKRRFTHTRLLSYRISR